MVIDLSKTIDVGPVDHTRRDAPAVSVSVRLRIDSESPTAAHWVAEQFVALVDLIEHRGP